VDEQNVENSSNNIHSETAPVTIEYAIEYLTELAYNCPDDKVNTVTSLADLLDNSVSLARSEVTRAVRVVPDSSIRKSIYDLCLQKLRLMSQDCKTEEMHPVISKDTAFKNSKLYTSLHSKSVEEPRSPAVTLTVNVNDQIYREKTTSLTSTSISRFEVR